MWLLLDINMEVIYGESNGTIKVDLEGQIPGH